MRDYPSFLYWANAARAVVAALGPAAPVAVAQLLLEFRIHRLSPGGRSVTRDPVALAKFPDKRILAGQVMQHTLLLEPFVGRGARMRGNEGVDRQTVLGAANERRRQVDRVVNDVDPRQVITATDPPRRHLCFVADHGTVAADGVFLPVRGGGSAAVAIPPGPGKAAPRVRRFLRRILTAVEIHGPIRRLVPLRLLRHEF